MSKLFDENACREIYLVFMESGFFLSNLLKPNFKHVYAIERQALGWLCSDPSKSDLHTYILPARYDSEVIQEFIRQNPTFTIIQLKVKPHYDSVFPSIGFISCVSVMQYILGVYWPFILTPYQLYNKIRNNPPKHIEVIAWHDTKYTQQKGKQQPQQRKLIHFVENLRRKLNLRKSEQIARR